MQGEYIADRLMVRMLRDIAGQRGLDFRSFSDDWILELSDHKQIRRTIGYRFDINNSAASMIAQDKVATHLILNKNNIDSVPHALVRTKVSDTNTDVLQEWDQIVMKPLVGTSGHGVRVFQNSSDAQRYIEDSSIHAWAASPFIDAWTETRIVMLDETVLLAYEKQPIEIRGLKMFNLGLGGTSVDITPNEKTLQLARSARSALGLRLCAVDILKAHDGSELVLEINDAVMMEHYSRQSDENEQRVRTVYERVVEKMFT